MLNVIINGKRAVLKKNISFEYVAENRRFTKSDSYTLEITFPLKDCIQNLEIFGMINRKDAEIKSMVFDCEMIDKSFHKKGSAIITEFSESEIKCQFLEGRSGSKLTSPIADVYINELDIASPSTSKEEISPLNAWSKYNDYVALPWVNNESGNIQNKIEYDEEYKWSSDTYGLSWMPYLTFVIKQICASVGYSCNISSIEEDSRLRYLLICNALPQQWFVPEVARALPHWTIEEFFEKLENFLFGEFEIDHIMKSIKYITPEELFDNANIIEITSDINEFSAEVFISESECSAMDASNIKYKESEHIWQKFYDCNGAVKRLWESDMVLEFENITELILQIQDKFWIMENGHRNMNLHKLYYIKNIKKYFCAGCFWEDPESKAKFMGLRNVNEFGEKVVSEDKDAKTIELEFVPACIDFTDGTYGFTLFNSPGSFSENSKSYNAYQSLEEMMNAPDTSTSDETSGGNHRGSGGAQDVISEDEFNMEKQEYYDRIFIGWWDGSIQFNKMNPFPNISEVLAVNINQVIINDFSLSIASDDSPFVKYSKNIDTTVRYNINFLTENLPSPRSIYLIKGKRYVCEKLTATMTERGMSSLVKGVFWRLKD